MTTVDEKTTSDLFFFWLINLIALLLTPFSLIMLCKSESKMRKFSTFLRSAQNSLKVINPNMPMAEDNGRLVSAKGPVDIPEGVVDPETGLKLNHALKLYRSVEMY